MKYKKVVKTIYLKGEDFVPGSLIVEPSDEVRFVNENRNAATIQSKGSLSISDFTLGFGKEKVIAFEKEGRFLFHSAADTSITVIVIFEFYFALTFFNNFNLLYCLVYY